MLCVRGTLLLARGTRFWGWLPSEEQKDNRKTWKRPESVAIFAAMS